MEVLKAAVDAIRKQKPRKTVVLTGAGVSADSGIPTFRGEGGLWRNYRAEDLATPEAFARDPLLVWEWYEWRRSLVRAAEPNAAHRAIASLADALVVTQNVDGLHQRAG
jgi:NAD-dependent deacetylase